MLTVKNIIIKMKVKMSANEYVLGQFRRMVVDNDGVDNMIKDLSELDEINTNNNLNVND